MPYFALQYEVVDDFANKRTPFRPAHLNEVRAANGRGELIMAGALADPAEALLIFRAADRSKPASSPTSSSSPTIRWWM